MSGPLRRYRVMALVVTAALFVLLLGMVLRYGFEEEGFSKAYSPVHGAIYMVYLVAVVQLGRAARWSLARTVGVMLAGAVPVVSYLVERRVLHDEQRRDQAAERLPDAGARP